jgi:hypothetical protein
MKPEVKVKASTSSAKASTTSVAPAKKASSAPIVPKAKEIEAPVPQAPAPPLDLKVSLNFVIFIQSFPFTIIISISFSNCSSTLAYFDHKNMYK